MEEHIKAARAALRQLDTSAGSPAQMALARLGLIEDRARVMRHQSEQAIAAHGRIVQQNAEHAQTHARLELEITRLTGLVEEMRAENKLIRDQHKQRAGEVGAVIHSLRDALTQHAQTLLEVTR